MVRDGIRCRRREFFEHLSSVDVTVTTVLYPTIAVKQVVLIPESLLKDLRSNYDLDPSWNKEEAEVICVQKFRLSYSLPVVRCHDLVPYGGDLFVDRGIRKP